LQSTSLPPMESSTSSTLSFKIFKILLCKYGQKYTKIGNIKVHIKKYLNVFFLLICLPGWSLFRNRIKYKVVDIIYVLGKNLPFLVTKVQEKVHTNFTIVIKYINWFPIVLNPKCWNTRVQIQEELVSDLMRKNDQREEIRAAIEINGKWNTKTRSEWSYYRWMKLQPNK
jgi:hypothetical protein